MLINLNHKLTMLFIINLFTVKYLIKWLNIQV
jgi:hypothetical protein